MDEKAPLVMYIYQFPGQKITQSLRSYISTTCEVLSESVHQNLA